MRIKKRIFPVLPLYFLNAVVFKVFCHTVSANIRMYILVKDYSYRFCFFLINLKFTVYQLITIWRKSAVPFSFAGFLDTPFHCLDTDIFPFNLGNC